MWLGYSVAAQIAAYPGQPPRWGDGLVAALPALVMLLLLAAMAHLAARNALVPWITLAQSVQARSPKDLGHIAIAPEDPMEVRTMAEALNRLFARAHAERNAQQRFIADAAHQLRTPLAALQSQVEAWALMAHAAPEKTIRSARAGRPAAPGLRHHMSWPTSCWRCRVWTADWGKVKQPSEWI